MVDLLLKHGTDIEAGGSDGLTPLQAATTGSRNDGMVRSLIKYEADAFVEDTFGRTVLHMAAQNNDVSLIRLFLHMGINPNKVDRLEETTLTGALRSGFEDDPEETIEIIETLLENRSAAAVVSQSCHR